MARRKKTERVVTPEEKLAQALVPVEEQPYPVPENWCWVYLTIGFAECMDSYRKPVNATERAERTGDIPYYGATGQIGWIDDFLTNEQLVLVGEDGAPFLDLFKDKAYIIEGKAWVNNHAHILRSYYGSVGNYYLKNYLNIFNYTGYVNGTTRLKLTQASLATIPVPMPPVTEQQRIVDCIDSMFAKLDGAKEKAQAVVDSFETRKAALLHKAFTGELTAQWRKNNCIEASLFLRQIDEEIRKTKKKTIKKVINIIDENYVSLPNNWLIVDLDRISKKITDGEHKTPNRVDSYCGYYLLSARNIHNDSLSLDDVDYIDKNEYDKISKRCNPQKGDVLISCSGSIGRTCVIDDENNYCMVRSAAMVSICRCNARYIMYAIQSDIVQHQIKRLSKQTAQANLFIGAIAAINIPLPPLEEQDEIVRIIDSIISKELRTKNIAEDIIDQIDTMKKSILTRAFCGGLGMNNPEEGSSIELLKSVLKEGQNE